VNAAQRIARLLSLLTSGLRIASVRMQGVKIGRGCKISPQCELGPGGGQARLGSIQIGDNCVLSRGAVMHSYDGSVQLGGNVFVGPFAVIYGHGGVKIGNDTLISMHCRILSSNHTIPPPGTIIRSQPDVLKPTRIGRDVWLGAGVTVLGGVTIGDGCVVGAGAVVTRDLPANTIAVGVPARAVGARS
jgi:acetyltransferase-like isoleucine patch superfamily enzyme